MAAGAALEDDHRIINHTSPSTPYIKAARTKGVAKDDLCHGVVLFGPLTAFLVALGLIDDEKHAFALLYQPPALLVRDFVPTEGTLSVRRR